ncbi:unnamed protein product [Gemmata massiliana]|uniref:Uncharacterized protein n=1 Tax=Gemmata massiliana TaxID=1210884 RepID=A0A6P2DGF6_9BACT|nr:hypothetical protein [Gemmata massiliana]VTR97969.1 unnamed protein product [Gemmata massiliana]VTR98912.1 unnamed protein product [Gemmata massiliana]
MIAATKNGERASVHSPCEPACPTCNGQLFLDTAPGGGIELLCTGCVAYELTPARPFALTIQDLPPALVFFRPSERDVYRAVRALGSQTPMPADIIERLNSEYAQQEPNPLKRKFASRVTVSHALTTLCRAGFVKRAMKGWGACAATNSKGGAL